MTRISLFLFGGFEVTLDGIPITAFESNKVRALLAYLAVEAHPEAGARWAHHGARPHERATLAGLLWPDHPEAAARTNLRHVLRQLRQTLPDSDPAQPLLLTSTRTLQFNPHANHTLDVKRFGELLAAAEGCGHPSLAACRECIERYTAAAALYRGPFLNGLSLHDSDLFEEWAATQRERLQRQALELYFTLATLHEEQGDAEQARHYAWRQLEVEPWREEAHRQLMRLFAQSGQRSAALAQYERCHTILADRLGIAPDPQTTALYEQIREWGVGSEGGGVGGGGWGVGGVGSGAVAPSPSTPYSPPSTPYSPPPTPYQDWGEAPTTAAFYGRESEQARLRRWLGEERMKLVMVLGMGGMGKTTLAARVAKTVADQFDFVFWRSLLNAPPPEEILRQALLFLSHQQLTQLPEGIGERINLLFEQLRQHRCLLVLDNLESVLEAGPAGQYRPGYEGYGQFIERMAQGEHGSCLVLTSRERPRGVEHLEEDFTWIGSLALDGLAPAAGQALLKVRGVANRDELVAAVIGRYSGNPLALKLVARTIEELFDGDLAAFLSDEAPIFDDIRLVLDQQFARLTPLEREILIWLAIEREGVTLQQLTQNMVVEPSRRQQVEAVRALQRRSLLEKSDSGFILQNVVTEYITDVVVDQALREIESGQFDLLQRHALLKAQAKEYVRQSQSRLLLAPLAKRLESSLGRASLPVHCRWLVECLRAAAQAEPKPARGYAAGNLLNLLLHLGVEIAGSDFSNLAVWQVYLRGVQAPGVNFTGSDLTGAAFTHRHGHIQGLHFRADGELLVVGVSEGMARVWRAANGAEIFAVPVRDPAHNFVCLHPNSRLAALGAADYAIALIDLVDGRLLHLLRGHQSPIWRLVFSPDGRLAASSDTVGNVCLWDIEQGVRLHHLQSHEAPVTALAFSPPEAPHALLATGAVDGQVCLWRLADGSLLRRFQAHREEVPVLQFASGGATLVTGSHDHTVSLWRVGDGERLAVLETHQQPVRLMAVAPDDRLIATGGGDTFIALWDVQTGEMRHILSDQQAPGLQIAFRRDGQQVAALDTNEIIHLWDVRDGRRLAFYSIYHNGIQSVGYRADGQRLIAAGREPTVYLWDVEDPTQVRVGTQLHGHAHRINSAVLSVDGATAASGDQSGELRLWNLHSGASRTLPARRGSVMAVAFDPTGAILASAGSDGAIQLWEVATGQPRFLLRGHSNVVLACVFSPDGRWLASSSIDRTVRLWDVASGGLLHTLGQHTNTVQNVCFLPDGRIVSCSYDQTIRIWDSERGELITTWSSPDTAYLSLAAHPNGLWLAAGSFRHVVHLFEVATGRLLGELHGHSRTVEAVSFQPNGRILASASHDETIRLWGGEAALAGAGACACLATFSAPGPYDGMKITGVTGISPAQKAALMALGAVD
jgi:WD40 repeat protein/DNA-binding SARP family transcriptional activator